MTRQLITNHLVRLICLPVLILTFISCFSPTFADEVFMTNGDRITGEIVRQTTAAIRLETSYAGTIEINWDEVSEVVLGELSKVLLDDESVIEVMGLARDGEMVVLTQPDSLSPVMLEATRVKSIEPEPWELGEGHKFTGAVNIATKVEQGNSEQTELDLDFNFNVKWWKSQWLSYGQLDYDTTRGVESTDNWSLINHYDYTFHGKWFASAALLLKHDFFADLKLRTTLGPALGYRFFSSDGLNLRTEASISYLIDNYYDQADEKAWGLGWYIDYDQKVWKQRLQLYLRQLGFFSFDQSDKNLFRIWAGVRVPLKAGFMGSLEYEMDYDSDPAVAAETTDKTFRLKLGYKW